METAKIFENGRSQAVRLPKKFRFNTDEVSSSSSVTPWILVPMESMWQTFMDGLNSSPTIFLRMAGIRASNRSVKICDLYAGHKYLHLRDEKQARTRIAAAEERIE